MPMSFRSAETEVLSYQMTTLDEKDRAPLKFPTHRASGGAGVVNNGGSRNAASAISKNHNN